MRRIEALGEKIRRHTDGGIYDSYFQDRDDEWILLCATMDILGDTSLALRDYEVVGLGREDGEKYIRLYGVLQSLFLQQDAIGYLYKIFVGEEFTTASVPIWMDLRDLRNLTSGHPMERGRGTRIQRCFLSRPTITDTAFQIIIWGKEQRKREFRDVRFRNLYEGYKTEAISVLEATYQSEQQRYPIANATGKTKGKVIRS